MEQQQAPANQITVFYSYEHTDERLRKQLETHLTSCGSKDVQERPIRPVNEIDNAKLSTD